MNQRGLRAALAVAVVMLAPAGLGCSSLLDLDVQYVSIDAGSTDDVSAPDGSPMGPRDGADASVGTGPGDANGASPGDATGASSGDANGVSAGDATADAPGDTGSATETAPDGSIAFIQVNVNQTGAQSSTVHLPNVQAHDTIIVCSDFTGGGPTPAVSDTLGNTYALAITLPNSSLDPNQDVGVAIFYALDVAAGDDTVTFTIPGSFPTSPYVEVYAQEYAGIGAFDVAAGQTGATTAMSSGFVTTTKAGDLVFGFAVAGSADPGAGFTARSIYNTNVTEDLIAGAPGMVAATAILTAGPAWAMQAAAFKAR